MTKINNNDRRYLCRYDQRYTHFGGGERLLKNFYSIENSLNRNRILLGVFFNIHIEVYLYLI